MNKKLYILSVVFLLIFSSCSEFLEKDPLVDISSGTFWQTKADYDMALTACYATMQNSIFSLNMPIWDAITDNAYGQHNSLGCNTMVQGNIDPSTTGFVKDLYLNSYSAISRLNIFLDKLYGYEGDEITAEDKALYEANAKFLRGFYYFFLYSCYGDVPLVTEPLTLETQIQPKVDAENVLSQLLTDIDFAIDNLSASPYFSGSGFAVKSSAQSLKARILLYTAYDSEGIPKSNVLTQAKQLLSAVITSGYELDSEFVNVFRDATQEGNKEIIFSVKYLAPNNAHSMDQWHGDWASVTPLPNFIDEFEMSNGVSIGTDGSGYNPEDIFENRDPRLEATVYTDYVDFGNGNVHHPSNPVLDFGLKKFLTPELIPYNYSTQSQQDWVVLRYAEVLLMYAEVQNELVGPDESVYKALNDIRSRAGIITALPSDLSKEEIRERIRHERRIELAFEGLRYYDLKRWRIAKEVLDAVDDSYVPYHFEDRFYLWPLPQSEIDKAGGVLVQNPDYN